MKRGTKGKAPPPRPVATQRQYQIHNLLNEARRSHRRLNCTTLARRFEVSVKTIQRDLDYLRNELEMPVEYDSAEKSFSYTTEQPYFPYGPPLENDERIALVVARQSLAGFAGVDFSAKLKSAFEKLTGGLLGEGRDVLEGKLDPYISVRTPGAGVIDDPKVFRAVRQALLNECVLRLSYKAKGRPAYMPRRLEPLHLACVENRWILVARDADKDEIRTYIVARCKDPIITQEKFKRPEVFDPERYLGTSFGAWTGSGAIVVRLRITAAGAHHVLERRWHATQQVTTLPEGAVEVSFKLGDLHDVTRWILGFGSDIEVVEPKDLRATIAAEGAKMAKVNAKQAQR